MKHITTLFFDFGGTLDSNGIHWKDRFYSLYRQIGLQVAKEDSDKAFYYAAGLLTQDPETSRWDLRRTVEIYAKLQLEGLGIANDEYAGFISDNFYHRASQAVEDSIRTLSRLRPKYRLGVISNNIGNTDVICDEFRLTPLLDAIIDSTVVGVSKPDPRIFQIALEQMGTQPHEAAYIGDSFERDMVGGKNAGLTTIWLVGDVEKECPDPSLVDSRIRRLSDLERILD